MIRKKTTWYSLDVWKYTVMFDAVSVFKWNSDGKSVFFYKATDIFLQQYM